MRYTIRSQSIKEREAEDTENTTELASNIQRLKHALKAYGSKVSSNRITRAKLSGVSNKKIYRLRNKVNLTKKYHT